MAAASTPNSHPAPAPAEPAVPTPPMSHTPFAKEDWIAAAMTFLISFLVFLYYMSPSVTLQDSGELVTGAYHFGVPHPPGYPLWAFLGWVWRHIIPFGNPAWRICLLSVLTGALVVGAMTLFMTRSILMLQRAAPWGDATDEKLKHWIALTVGASVSLLFGFNRGVWLWASVPEMRVLNVLFFTLTTCTFFAWVMRPERYAFLYTTILVYALGISNHQTIAVMGGTFLLGALLVGWHNAPAGQPRWRSLAACYELLVMFLVVWALSLVAVAWLQTAPGLPPLIAQKMKLLVLAGPVVTGVPTAVLIGAAALALAVWGSVEKVLNPRRAAVLTALLIVGIGFYVYMPIASATNPPMNWGFASTKQGFLHAFMRGQYEQLSLSTPLDKRLMQVSLFTDALINQYSLVLVLIGLVPLGVLIYFWVKLHPRARIWLLFIGIAFTISSYGLIKFINPGLEKQQQEINIKFFAPAHGFYAVLIGYGIVALLGLALAKWPQLPRQAVRLGCIALLALPAITFSRNWKICEQRGHDFGYQFGYRMFYPGGDYPPMDQNAVLYGGTDPGRFVPTYMIFCESFAKPEDRFQSPHLPPGTGAAFDRRDVYIITQNALADATYMSYIRNHYDYSRPNWNNPATITNRPAWQQHLFGWAWHALGRKDAYPKQPIWIPSENDIQRAFQEYVQSLRNQPAGPDEQVEIINGRVSVRGVGGVMKINGILTKWIFDRNKDKHSFYVEESYVIPWMYPYLTPAGIIMKINKDPLPPPEQDPALWQQIIARDRAYWDKLVAEFKARPEFHRDTDAQKTFSKLRSAIGGLYSARRLAREAEYAFRQARELCLDSPEANFRLAQLYMDWQPPREQDAIQVLTELKTLDPLNTKIQQAIDQLTQIAAARNDIGRLQANFEVAPHEISRLVPLVQALARAGYPDRINPLCDQYLAQPNLTAAEMIQIAQLYISLNMPDRAVGALQTTLSRYPQDSQSWYAVAIIRGAMGAVDEALDALARAIEITPALRDQARSDQRLNPLRNHPRFLQLVGGAPPLSPFPTR